ncbi:cobalamin biosynthesis protein [Novosphingobium sp. RD2P27]|uniref:Cobalamin biosynthesis protein n=1 Tax=Novosphingobium kalidii TaxID=3230299 RepID=A0ABV2D2G8_9SPHN
MIVAGFGFRKGTALSSLRAALALAQEGHEPVRWLTTAQDKAEGLLPLAEAMSLPLVALSPEALTAAETQTRSAASFAARGTGSVAEACALAAAGPGARLLRPRQISPDRMATCAIAQGPST